MKTLKNLKEEAILQVLSSSKGHWRETVNNYFLDHIAFLSSITYLLSHDVILTFNSAFQLELTFFGILWSK